MKNYGSMRTLLTAHTIAYEVLHIMGNGEAEIAMHFMPDDNIRLELLFQSKYSTKDFKYEDLKLSLDDFADKHIKPLIGGLSESTRNSLRNDGMWSKASLAA